MPKHARSPLNIKAHFVMNRIYGVSKLMQVKNRVGIGNDLVKNMISGFVLFCIILYV